MSPRIITGTIAPRNFDVCSESSRKYEPILYGWRKGGEHYWCGARNQGDVWEFPRPTRNDLHPTMKPVALVERAIRNSSQPKDLILDPFAGSGSTLMAAEAAGRRAALIEIDPAYCDVIVRRYQEATTKSAIHELDKLSYQQVAENRSVKE